MYIKCLVFYQLIVFRNVLSTSEKVRSKRALLFPGSSTVGILVALAVPLELPHRNIFMSYNFEANYNSPYLPASYIPGPLERFDLIERRNFNSDSDSAKDGREKRTIERPSLLSRAKAYQILENKLEYVGLLGKECLLRLICEVNKDKIGYNNGVLGDILQIIFSPSTSKREDLPQEYYDAEMQGIKRNCKKYRKLCSENALDYISEIVRI